MNLEEFDNKLSEAFKYEHLPPNDKLWQNISSRLVSKKKPYWFWIFPVAIIALVGVGVSSWWYNNDKTKDHAIVKTDMEGANTERQIERISANNSKEKNNLKNSNNTVLENIEQEKIADNNNTKKNTRPFKPSFSALNSQEGNAEKSNISNNANTQKVKPKKGSSEKKSSTKGKTANTPKSKTKLPFLADRQTKQITQTEKVSRATQADEMNITSLIFAKHKKLQTTKLQFSALMPNYLTSLNPSISKYPKTSNNKNREADFDSKWWWSAGIGPQLCLNNMKVSDSLKPYVHFYLWDKKKHVTNNSSGFQTQFSLKYKINSLFSVEAGLQYSLHLENIQFYEENEWIVKERFVSQTGKIKSYFKDTHYFIDRNSGFPDTLGYSPILHSFMLFTKNNYHNLSIPIKLNAEFDITSSAKVQFGLGLGLTYLYSKKFSHIDLVTGEKITQKSKGYLTSSFNTQLAFYTNFNNLGEIGVYTGFQGYVGRLNVVNKQYSIGMQDMQLGMCFRRPF